jgi:four helix bundle protein
MTPDELRKRLAQFAVRVEGLTRSMIDTTATRDAALQLRRATTSASANHRAAGRGRSRAEFVSKLSVALEEADESLYWLEHLVACGHASRSGTQPLVTEAKELVAILTRSVDTTRRRR